MVCYVNLGNHLRKKTTNLHLFKYQGYQIVVLLYKCCTYDAHACSGSKQ